MPTQMPFEGLLLGAALTVVGLIISWVVWRRRGASAGLRAVAWSLLPLAFGLVGLMGLLASLAGQLVRFFAGLVLDPLAWAGVAVAGLAAGCGPLVGCCGDGGAGPVGPPRTRSSPRPRRAVRARPPWAGPSRGRAPPPRAPTTTSPRSRRCCASAGSADPPRGAHRPQGPVPIGNGAPSLWGGPAVPGEERVRD